MPHGAPVHRLPHTSRVSLRIQEDSPIPPRPTITRIETFEFTIELRGVGFGAKLPGVLMQSDQVVRPKRCAIRIETDLGITGECVGPLVVAARQVDLLAAHLLGADPLAREPLYHAMRLSLGQHDGIGVGLVDIALWDLAGKFYDAPIYELLGGRRRPLKAYASTYPGDRAGGGLHTPQRFADFAVQCREAGYRGFKIHSWVDDVDIAEEVATVLAVREAAGPEMDLMLDPAGVYRTFADTLRVGRALDDANYFWYEDPYRDLGGATSAHRKLRQLIRTPLLRSDFVRGVEAQVEIMRTGSTDFGRAAAYHDGGITGALKIARAAEGFGLDVELHSCNPAHRHLMAALRNTNYYEMNLLHPTGDSSAFNHYLGDYRDTLDAVDADGCVYAPEGPGLGVAIDWDYINANRTDGKVFEQ